MKAYPFQHKNPTSGLVSESEGMDLRDYFAAKSLDVAMNEVKNFYGADKHDVARWCYEMADAMMEARNANN